MANKRIIDLTDGTAIPVAAGDLCEVWNVALARSEKKNATQSAAFTRAVIEASGVNFIGPVTWNGTSSLNADGSITIAGGTIHLEVAGNITWGNGVSSLTAVGGIDVGSGSTSINVDGTASFSLGGVVIDALGGLTLQGGLKVASGGNIFEIDSDGKIGAFASPPVGQQPCAALTNSVANSGTVDTIDDFTGTDYTTDGPIIVGDVYQLARKLKEVVDALRAYGIVA